MKVRGYYHSRNSGGYEHGVGQLSDRSIYQEFAKEISGERVEGAGYGAIFIGSGIFGMGQAGSHKLRIELAE